MKKLIVIGCYPNSEKKEQVLKDELKSLKNIDFDLMLVSHYPVSVELQSMVDYYIYDKNQTLTPLNMCSHWWLANDAFTINIFNARHALPICQNMFNSFKFSEIKEYDFVYFIENDNVFSEKDSIKLSKLVDDMVIKNKKCIFFKPESFREADSYVYETQLFGVTPKYFNEIFNLPTKEEEWIYEELGYTLELAFFRKLNSFEENFLIIDEHSSEYFNTSEINIFRVEDFVFEVVHNNTNPEQPILFLSCGSRKPIERKVLIKINGEVIQDLIMFSSHWSYFPLSLDGGELCVEVYENDILENIKTYKLNNDLLINLNHKGIIEFN